METVEDIIKEIRQIAHNISVADEKTLSMFRPVAAFSRIADRLDAAYKRDLQAMVDASEIDMRTATDEVQKLQKENERLKEALRPVLNTDTESEDVELGEVSELIYAIESAQRIYKGGAE